MFEKLPVSPWSWFSNPVQVPAWLICICSYIDIMLQNYDFRNNQVHVTIHNRMDANDAGLGYPRINLHVNKYITSNLNPSCDPRKGGGVARHGSRLQSQEKINQRRRRYAKLRYAAEYSADRLRGRRFWLWRLGVECSENERAKTPSGCISFTDERQAIADKSLDLRQRASGTHIIIFAMSVAAWPPPTNGGEVDSHAATRARAR
ncbi:hypothetical protein C8J57DRAFT_1232865 [Mycena rebaudengoi]|nr:hypothetical protein C8J57DRAFT_1232865 [Mycena rebaudengoi]